MNNIILVGMPGAGKSTIGVILAKVLGYQFLDSDLIIQEKEQRLLSEIIEAEGIDGFIDVEEKINSEIEADKCVIATGGSVVYGDRAMNHLKAIGTVVYIKLSYETLCKRLGNIKQRGVVLRNGQDLQDLYYERCPLYEQYADIVLDAEELSIEELMERIADNFI